MHTKFILISNIAYSKCLPLETHSEDDRENLDNGDNFEIFWDGIFKEKIYKILFLSSNHDILLLI